MGRLIDADVNRDEFMEEVYDILSDEPDNIKANLIIDAFDEIQTAYDPDKVVEQLYGLKKYGNKYDSYWDSSLYRMTEFENKTINDAVEKAIEIVKGGGVDV